MNKTKKKKTAKKSTKNRPNKGYHLLMYVVNCEPKLKKFTNLQSMNNFIKAFNAKWPDDLSQNTGCWIDLLVQDVHGEIKFLAEGIERT